MFPGIPVCLPSTLFRISVLDRFTREQQAPRSLQVPLLSSPRPRVNYSRTCPTDRPTPPASALSRVAGCFRSRVRKSRYTQRVKHLSVGDRFQGFSPFDLLSAEAIGRDRSAEIRADRKRRFRSRDRSIPRSIPRDFPSSGLVHTGSKTIPRRFIVPFRDRSCRRKK